MEPEPFIRYSSFVPQKQVNVPARRRLGEAYIEVRARLRTPGLFVGIDATQKVILTDALCNQLLQDMRS